MEPSTQRRDQLRLRQTFNKRLTASVCIIAFSQANFGFVQLGFSGAQAMDPFIERFGTYNPKTKAYYIEPYWLSLFNSLPFITFGFGILLGSYISKRWGRRICVFSMSVWSLIPSIITVTSQSREQVMAGRILSYIYVGMELAVVPIYQAEIVPSNARGFIVVTYQASLVIGALIINLICRGTMNIPSDASWRIPLGLSFIVPSIVAVSCWIIPESPRWYALKGRHEQGLESLRKLRVGKFSEEEIERQYAIIKANTAHQLQLEKGTFLDQFKKLNMRRSIIVIGTNFFLQATGNTFATIYLAVFVKNLGTVNPFDITITATSVNVAVALVIMVLIEKVGRRRLILIGSVLQVVAWMTMAALASVTPTTKPLLAGIVAMLVLFQFSISLGWAPVSHSLSAEIPSTAVRDMTYRTASIVNIVMQFAVTFSLPYLLYAPYANLGGKVGYIFGGVSIVSFFFAYFCIPEVQGRSLEELDALFEMGVSTRKFRHTKITLEATPNENDQSASKEATIHVEISDDRADERA